MGSAVTQGRPTEAWGSVENPEPAHTACPPPLPLRQAQKAGLADGGQKAKPRPDRAAGLPPLPPAPAPRAREQMVRLLIPHCLRGPGTPATEGQGLSAGDAETGRQIILGQAGLSFCQRKRWRDSGGHGTHLPLPPGLSSAQGTEAVVVSSRVETSWGAHAGELCFWGGRTWVDTLTPCRGSPPLSSLP